MRIECAGGYFFRRHLGNGQAFTRQHGFVDGTAAFQHRAVNGDGFARFDHHDIARLQFDDGCLAGFLRIGVIGHMMAKRRNQLDQPFGGIACLTAGDLFHKTSAQQKKQQHGDGFEIHPLPRIGRKAVNAGDKGHDDGDGNRRIHADAAVFQVAQRALIKRNGAIEYDGQHHQEAAPMEDLQEIGFDVAAVKVGRQREHHRLHHPQSGNGKADDVLFAFFLVGGFDFLRVIGCGGVACLPDFQQNVGEADFFVVPYGPAAPGTVIEIDADDAVCTQKLLFDKPNAGGTGNAAQHQHRLMRTVMGFDKIRLHLG